LLRRLDPRQRKTLILFARSREITAKDIAALIGLQQRATALLCQRWVAAGFLVMTDPAKKSRRYRLADAYEELIRVA
jgi:hypothetical protein